jgi:hypothetical protein
MTLDRIYDPWKDSFNLLYTFKAEVEKACQGSVVEIDNHTVEYKVRGKTMEKRMFHEGFCFIQGMLEGVPSWVQALFGSGCNCSKWKV